jgi:hypothetical protein
MQQHVTYISNVFTNEDAPNNHYYHHQQVQQQQHFSLISLLSDFISEGIGQNQMIFICAVQVMF